MPEPPKGNNGGQTATAPASSATGTTSALAFVDQLEKQAADLKRELRSYGDAATVGRDTQALGGYFDSIQRCVVQIAHAMNISWSPSNSS